MNPAASWQCERGAETEEFMAQDDTKSAGTAQVALPTERIQFKSLVLGNPNYFGTFSKFGGKVIKAMSGDTAYEQLTCLGLNPGSAILEAVIDIKQSSGYGTNACGTGTIEYVRFFVEDGSGWHDLGLSSVQVFDVSGPLPLSYAVSVDFTEARKFCFTENIVQVRAILSWEWAPTAGDPGFIPVWGNVLNARVQVAPRLLIEIPISELIAQKTISIDPGILKEVDTAQPLPASPLKPLSFGELKALYANTKVPSHRFGLQLATKISSATIDLALAQITPSNVSISSLLTADDLAAILAGLAKTSGDTQFEQLTCAGYNPQTRELEGVIQIKQSSGYAGGLCTNGSVEYVSFYAFFGGAWNALGTAQVQVHDLTAASATNPISYAVFQLSNLTSMPCETLAGVPLRAILSWSTPATGPNFIPVWGNVLNTHVQPQITAGVSEGLELMRIGRVEVSSIDSSTGLAMPYPPVADDCVGNSSPFGGAPTVEGAFFPANADSVFDPVTGMVLAGAKPIIYQAWVTPSGGTRTQLTNGFWIAIYSPTINPPIGNVNFFQTTGPAPGPVAGALPGAVYYTYYESGAQLVDPRALAVFDTSGLPEGNYTIEIDGFAWDTGLSQYVAVLPVQSRLIHVYNGFPHDEPTEPVLGGPIVEVPEQRPQLFITITAPAGDCGDVPVGATISGSYSVTDEFFGSLSLGLVQITVGGIIQPENPVILTVVSPPGSNPVAYDGTNTTGTSGAFTLDTTGMTPCGYTILLSSWDRALVSDSCQGHYNQEGVGFCLRKAGT
jgi:hypothetical protein